MSEDPVVARTDDGVEKVARLIAESHHNHLPVVDGDGRFAGMVTRADALAALLDGE
ncbi:MAG: CBS domain-containing protein [Solirubrobacterales bacterium]